MMYRNLDIIDKDDYQLYSDPKSPPYNRGTVNNIIYRNHLGIYIRNIPVIKYIPILRLKYMIDAGYDFRNNKIFAKMIK